MENPDTGAGASLSLSCSEFSDGGAIPRRFTCDGDDVSPPLEWSGAPPGVSRPGRDR
jgi:phosphatidylethanolamine-binding protein (PEBP) family uncharacterized protein